MIHLPLHINHLLKLFEYDGLLHWCIWISVVIFFVGVVWLVIRVLLPLRALAKQANSIMNGEFHSFDTPIAGIQEVVDLHHSLQYMMLQIQTAQKREISYRHAITESQEHERLRIAREIHDDTIQNLILVGHHLERATHSWGVHVDTMASHLKKARVQLVEVIDDLRQIIADLRPSVLDELGLVIAVETLCERNQGIVLCVTGVPCLLESSQELALFRIVQEAIHNAEHHAQAERIVVNLHYSNSIVTLQIQDDGVGFEVPKHLQELVAKGHYGLMGISERVFHLGGKLAIDSCIGGGTTLCVTLATEPSLFMVAA